MPHYEITGMRSHRHPFYGWGSYGAEEDPWGVDDEEKVARSNEDWLSFVAPSPMPATPAPTGPDPQVLAAPAKKSNLAPVLIIGGVAIAMLLLLR